MSKAIERLVVAGAVGVFIVGTGLGVNLAFSEPPAVESQDETCETKSVATGEQLTSNLVMVHVYNTSARAGLANRVKINLERRGFLGGMASNNPGKIAAKNVTILTKDPGDPTVKLVALQFKGKVATAAPDFATEENGVSILIGPDYAGLKKGAKTALKVGQDVAVCVPTVTLP